MRERFIHDKNEAPIAKTPVLDLETSTELGVITVDHENTRVRLFGNGFEGLDHVEYCDSDGQLTGILFGEFVDPDAKDKLIEFNYPRNFDPIPLVEDSVWYDDALLARHNIAPLAQKVSTAELDPGAPEDSSRTGILNTAASCLIAGVALAGTLGSAVYRKL